VERLEEAFTEIGAVAGDDGRPLVEARGVDSRECLAWRDVLSKIDEELIIWARTFKRVFGTAQEPSAEDFGGKDEVDSGQDGDDYAKSYEDWDQAGKEGSETCRRKQQPRPRLGTCRSGAFTRTSHGATPEG